MLFKIYSKQCLLLAELFVLLNGFTHHKAEVQIETGTPHRRPNLCKY